MLRFNQLPVQLILLIILHDRKKCDSYALVLVWDHSNGSSTSSTTCPSVTLATYWCEIHAKVQSASSINNPNIILPHKNCLLPMQVQHSASYSKIARITLLQDCLIVPENSSTELWINQCVFPGCHTHSQWHCLHLSSSAAFHASLSS